MCFRKREKEVVTEEVTRLDPRGMIRTDIQFIKRHLPDLGWVKGDTIEEVSYKQGQHDLLRFIEQKVVGRRLDGSVSIVTGSRDKTTKES